MHKVFCLTHGEDKKGYDVSGDDVIEKDGIIYCKKCWNDGPKLFDVSDYDRNEFNKHDLSIITYINQLATHIMELKSDFASLRSELNYLQDEFRKL